MDTTIQTQTQKSPEKQKRDDGHGGGGCVLLVLWAANEAARLEAANKAGETYAAAEAEGETLEGEGSMYLKGACSKGGSSGSGRGRNSGGRSKYFLEGANSEKGISDDARDKGYIAHCDFGTS